MIYKVYSAEFKLSLIKEFYERKATFRNFAKEKGISASTLSSWIHKARREAIIPYNNNSKILRNNLIDITDLSKQIISEERNNNINVFILETKNMKLTLPINSLKEVLEVIHHD